MATLTVFLYVLVVIVSLLLIGVIMIQPAKSGGMGATFGGVGESVFGAHAGSHLTKATVIMTTVFFVVTLVLAALIGRGVKFDDGSDAVSAELRAAAPAAPAAPVAADAADAKK